MAINDPFADLRILTMHEVCELTHYSRTHIYRLEKAGQFPRRLKMGPGRIGFRRSDYEKWFHSRPFAPKPPDDPDDGSDDAA